MQGLIWKHYLDEKEKIESHSLFNPDDKDMNLLSMPGGEDKFFAKKLM